MAAAARTVDRQPVTAGHATSRRPGRDMPRPPTLHREPRGSLAIARHYVRDLVYGANDGLITTFAVVAGVVGGDLSYRATLTVVWAHLFADRPSTARRDY